MTCRCVGRFDEPFRGADFKAYLREILGSTAQHVWREKTSFETERAGAFHG